jgi:hypothetical protein
VTAILVVSISVARRSGSRPGRRRLALTAAVAVLFVVVLAVLFASVDPCAQGPA